MSKELGELVFLGQAGWPEVAIKAHVKEMCNSTAFDDSEQARVLLPFLVDKALSGRIISAKDIAFWLRKLDFGKGDSFVRTAMRRLRKRMQAYYATLPRKHLGIWLTIPDETYLVLARRNNSPRLTVNIPAIASILEPEEQAEVYRRVSVLGSIESLDLDARPWLIVLAPDTFYYPQCRVSRRSSSWEYEVRIGSGEWGTTDGAEFNILLVSAGVDGDFDLEAFMKRNGDAYGVRLPSDTQVIATRRVVRRDVRPESRQASFDPGSHALLWIVLLPRWPFQFLRPSYRV